MTTTTDFDFTKTYTAEGYSGVAFRATHFETEMVEQEYDVYFGEDAEEVYTETEWVEEHTGRVVAHMVGDDRDFSFDVSELTVLDEDDYCAECGQVGCTADGRERDV